MIPVHEASKEELEAALAKLNDPYKKFKDALATGRRVRCAGGAWYNASTNSFSWLNPPEDYEIEPEYYGVTAAQWQFVIDGGFLITPYDSSSEDVVWETHLVNMDVDRECKFETPDGARYFCCKIVREKGLKQPAFGRDIATDAKILVHNRHSGLCDLAVAGSTNWNSVDWFIEL